jgi:hypothetical protein
MRIVVIACFACLLELLACTSNGEFTCTPICSPGPGGGQDRGGTDMYKISASTSDDAGSDCLVMAKSDGSACPATYTPVSCTCTE